MQQPLAGALVLQLLKHFALNTSLMEKIIICVICTSYTGFLKQVFDQRYIFRLYALMVLLKTLSNFTKFGIEAGNWSRNSNLCFFSLFEKGCGGPRPFHVLRKPMYEFLFLMAQTDPLLQYSNDIECFSHKNGKI